MSYADALEVQRAAARARIDGVIVDDLLLLVEHPAVVTTGRSTKAAHVLLTPEAFAARGVELFDVDRGGDVTFHGPGQLVGYPIIDLQNHKADLHWYLRQLETALIRALATFDIRGEQSPGLTGVWTFGRKIASIGVHARQWITWHGFALNVTTDLSYFDMLVPCGIANVTMTSIRTRISFAANPTHVSRLHPHSARKHARQVVTGLAETFGWAPIDFSIDDLRTQLATTAQPTATKS